MDGPKLEVTLMEKPQMIILELQVTSDDGNVLAIGANGNDGVGDASGHVRIYKNNSGIWQQIGSDIDGEVTDASGTSVFICRGSVIAIELMGMMLEDLALGM